jgi:valyl-tRNA synthetase
MKVLEKAFEPEAYEPRIARLWEESALFAPRPGRTGQVFTLVIPPPNVTGALHIGHALDYTLQDVVVRWHRMLGDETLWVPGSDHAGIATQMVVERHLARQGTNRHELGRERFVDEVWRWKDEYRQRIVDTLRRLGCSCDWSRERFTLDPGFSRAVRETFVRLYEEGLIYRGERLINWSVGTRTALSDLEVLREQEEEGELWSFAYPVEGGGEIVVATTRPETMLGDTAVAVHPEDERWKGVIGKRVEHPFFPDRDVSIIADEILADPETGTGAVKVTPAHDPNDFACGQRHDLPAISLMNPDGTLNDNAGPFAGLDRFEARERVKEALSERGLFRGAKKHRYTPGRCQRSGTIVEPMLSTQWFVRMEPLAGPALDAVRSGAIRFVPDSWEKTYFHWLENIEDWCISRQLWWGHRIPAWHCGACGELTVAREDPDRCAHCGSERIEQDPDVLDTWFSSQLWPFGVFGWPEPTTELERFHPTSVLVTGFDIIFFWVARMIMSSLHLTGKIPFHTVLYHGLVRDAQGRKMSKSLGNAVDPNEVMGEHGVDAVRFTLAALASPGSDLALSEERLAGYRAFLNKLWNATRFLLMRLPDSDAAVRVDYAADELDEIDRYLVASYLELVTRTDAAMRAFRYDQAAEQIYHFLWHTFCDWSIELSKPDFGEGRDERRAAVRLAVLLDVLDGALRLLHPIAPFITEELWQHLPRRAGDPECLAGAAYPVPGDPAVPVPQELAGAAAREAVERWLIEPVGAVRSLRTGAGIAPAREVTVRLRARQAGVAACIAPFRERIGALTRASEVDILEGDAPDEPALRQVLDAVEVIVPLAGAVDLDKERERLDREHKKLDKERAGLARKLGNEGFLAKAPPAVVEKDRARLASVESRLADVARTREQLG